MTIDLEAIDEAGRLEAGILEVLVEKLSPYDPADVLAAVGGLQLLPENADRAVRLEATGLAPGAKRGEPGGHDGLRYGADQLTNRLQ